MAGFVQGYKISIHALREEGDHGGWVQRRKLHISIHALREEGDLCAFLRRSARHYFYPRPPRGGRRDPRCELPKVRNFYPRPPRGGRPISRRLRRKFSNFYPRPPRGGRPRSGQARRRSAAFLSTPSARRATITGPENSFWWSISIHALREEGDVTTMAVFGFMVEISIHALREEGDVYFSSKIAFTSGFLSTPSARRATLRCYSSPVSSPNFYPRPPRGGRRQRPA